MVQGTVHIDSDSESNSELRKFISTHKNRQRAKQIRETFAPALLNVFEVSTGAAYLQRPRYGSGMSRHELLMTAVSEEFMLNEKQDIAY